MCDILSYYINLIGKLIGNKMSFEEIELNNKYHLNNLFQYDSENTNDKTTLVKVNNQLMSVYKINRIKISSALNKAWLSLIYEDITDEKLVFSFQHNNNSQQNFNNFIQFCLSHINKNKSEYSFCNSLKQLILNKNEVENLIHKLHLTHAQDKPTDEEVASRCYCCYTDEDNDLSFVEFELQSNFVDIDYFIKIFQRKILRFSSNNCFQ